jgi:EmrB/QacA subfamily drug resistance transporter
MLPVALSATLMYGFDFNVVNVAIPSVRHDLHAGPASLELVVGGYAFTYAAGLVTGGRLGDLFGYRTMFLAGMAGFTVASVACGLAGTPGELVAARLVQGLTAAAMVPQVFALITSVFPVEERTRALAWFSVTASLSGLLGQVVGGLLLDANVFGLGWRVAFFVNLPVGVIVLGLARRLLPRTTSLRRPSLDPVGVVAVSGSLALALIPLTLGRGEGWPPWTWVLLAASAPAMILALVYERRLAGRGGDPLVDLALVRLRTFGAGLGIAAAFMAYFTSSVFVMSLLLQDGLGLTPLQAGLSFAPMALLAMAAPFLGRRMIITFGAPTAIVCGCVVNTVATALLASLLALQGGNVSVGWLIAGLGLVGLGNTFILPTYLGAALSDVRPDQAGAASGTLNTTQQFAGSAGLAIIGAVFFTALGPHPGRAQYAHAAQIAIWIDLGLVIAMAALTAFLPRGSATPDRPTRPASTHASTPASTHASTPASIPASAPAAIAPATERR